MGEFMKLYNDFSAGIIDENGTGRFDSALYQKGASMLKNVVVKPDGSVRKRKGLVGVFDGPQYADASGSVPAWLTKTASAPANCYKTSDVYETAGIYSDALTTEDMIDGVVVTSFEDSVDGTAYTGVAITGSYEDRVVEEVKHCPNIKLSDVDVMEGGATTELSDSSIVYAPRPIYDKIPLYEKVREDKAPLGDFFYVVHYDFISRVSNQVVEPEGRMNEQQSAVRETNNLFNMLFPVMAENSDEKCNHALLAVDYPYDGVQPGIYINKVYQADGGKAAGCDVLYAFQKAFFGGQSIADVSPIYYLDNGKMVRITSLENIPSDHYRNGVFCDVYCIIPMHNTNPNNKIFLYRRYIPNENRYMPDDRIVVAGVYPSIITDETDLPDYGSQTYIANIFADSVGIFVKVSANNITVVSVSGDDVTISQDVLGAIGEYDTKKFIIANNGTTTTSTDKHAYITTSELAKQAKENGFTSPVVHSDAIKEISATINGTDYSNLEKLEFGDNYISATTADGTVVSVGASDSSEEGYIKDTATISYKYANPNYGKIADGYSVRLFRINGTGAPDSKEDHLLGMIYLLNGGIYLRIYRFNSRNGELADTESGSWVDAESAERQLGTYASYTDVDSICVTSLGYDLYVTDIHEEPFVIRISNEDGKITLSKYSIGFTTSASSGLNFTTMGYPAFNWFSGMRWWLGGFEKSAGTIMASRVPDEAGATRYNDFSMYDSSTDTNGHEVKTVLSSHAIKLTEDIPYLNGFGLRWVAHGLRDVFAFENVIMMDSGQVATPSSYDLIPTIYANVGSCRPVVYGNAVYFTGANNRTINCMAYDDNAGGYVSYRLSDEVANIIQNGGGVIRMAINDGKEKHLAAILSDGSFLYGLILGIDRIAWSLISGKMKFSDILQVVYTSIDGYDYDRLLAATTYGGVISSGYFDDNEGDEARYADYYETVKTSDNHVYQTSNLLKWVYPYEGSPSPVGIPNELIVDGKLADDAILTNVNALVDGEEKNIRGWVTNHYCSNEWGIGFTYDTQITTLPIFYDENIGLMMCRDRNITDILFRVEETGDFKVSCNDRGGSNQAFSSSLYDVYNYSEEIPYVTGNYRMQFVSTVSDEASITLTSENAYPLDLKVLVLRGKVEDRL